MRLFEEERRLADIGCVVSMAIVVGHPFYTPFPTVVDYTLDRMLEASPIPGVSFGIQPKYDGARAMVIERPLAEAELDALCTLIIAARTAVILEHAV